MAESDQRGRVIKALRRLDAVSVENPVGPGTPDVNYVDGWIELKWLRDWPKRGGTRVELDHYTEQQRVWAMKRRRAGGTVWMLLQCKTEWVLIDGLVAAMSTLGRGATRAEIYELATRHWLKGLVEKELEACVSQDQRDFSSIVAERR